MGPHLPPPAPAITYLTDVHFASGAAARLPEVLRGLGVQRPLIVTDGGVLALGLVERLGLERPAVFAGVSANPTEEDVEAGAQAYRASGCDGVVAIGGGSPMDGAKAIALLATHAPPLEQYAFVRGGLARITRAKPPVVAVPTTAGTGSEVGRAALITLRSGPKLALISKHLIPDAAICDPQLTLGLPARLTAATGMDAVTHCVETYLSPRFNPVAEAIALDGLTRALRFLPAAVRHGGDLEARGEMMMAALEGGLTFQKGLGLVHALSHPLGSLRSRAPHHGMLNAVLLPHALRFNAGACGAKMEALSRVAGVPPAALAGHFEDMTRSLALPACLRDLGLTRDDLSHIPRMALEDHSCPTNPRPIRLEDCSAVLDAAF